MTLRAVCISFVVALVLFLVVLVLQLPSAAGDSASRTGGSAAIVAVVAVVAVLVARRFERPLDCTSDATLVKSYGNRFFIPVAGAEIGALAGFIAAQVTRSPIPYLPGLAIALLAFSRAAPTARHLAADDEALGVAGCSRSVVAALLTPP